MPVGAPVQCRVAFYPLHLGPAGVVAYPGPVGLQFGMQGMMQPISGIPREFLPGLPPTLILAFTNGYCSIAPCCSHSAPTHTNRCCGLVQPVPLLQAFVLTCTSGCCGPAETSPNIPTKSVPSPSSCVCWLVSALVCVGREALQIPFSEPLITCTCCSLVHGNSKKLFYICQTDPRWVPF